MDVPSIERQARAFAHPILIGAEADKAVAAIVEWELQNQSADSTSRENAWARLVQQNA